MNKTIILGKGLEDIEIILVSGKSIFLNPPGSIRFLIKAEKIIKINISDYQKFKKLATECNEDIDFSKLEKEDFEKIALSLSKYIKDDYLPSSNPFDDFFKILEEYIMQEVAKIVDIMKPAINAMTSPFSKFVIPTIESINRGTQDIVKKLNPIFKDQSVMKMVL